MEACEAICSSICAAPAGGFAHFHPPPPRSGMRQWGFGYRHDYYHLPVSKVVLQQKIVEQEWHCAIFEVVRSSRCCTCPCIGAGSQLALTVHGPGPRATMPQFL